MTQSNIIARALAAEFSVLYYALAWKPKPHTQAGTRPFSMHERSGASVLMACMAVLSLVEAVPVHLPLAYKWSSTAAWVATGLSLWGAVRMTAMSRAFRLRPTLVDPDGLVVRNGLLFRLSIPADSIRSIGIGADVPAGGQIIPKDTPAEVRIRFNQPLEAQLLLGFTKRIHVIGLSADDAAGFARALNDLAFRK